MRHRLQLFLFLSASIPCVALSSGFAQSTAPSRVTPETFAPPVVRASGGLNLGSVEPGQVPAGAEALSVKVGAVVVEGGQPALKGETNAATARISGQTVSAKAIYGAAAEIEAAYARAGYVLTRVTVPPQKLVNGGTLKLLVVDGFIEAIDDTAVPASQRAAVHARVQGLIGARGLTLADIERKLLIAGDIPGLKLRSAIVKGTQVGGAKLVLEGDWRPVTVSVGVDNKVGSEYRGVEFPVSASLNSVFGFGEQIYGSAIIGPDIDKIFGGQPTRRIYGLGAIVPLGIDGWTINPEYTRSDTNPRVFAPTSPTTGLYERWAFRSLYPILKTRAATLNLTNSFEIMNETQQLTEFSTPQSIDRLRIFTAGLEATKALDWNATIAGGLLATQGLSGLGARTETDALASGIPLSRAGSRPDFTKIEGHLRYDQAIPADFTASGIIRAQEAISGPMPSAAQFALDGDDGLSAFPLGTLSVDSGITTRGEFGRPFAFSSTPLSGVAAPYVFAAFGAGTIDNPTAVELARVIANSYGAGMRINLAETSSGLNSILAFELGRSHANIVVRDQTRFVASFTLRY